MSKARNQTATTAAPIKPATTPSRRIDRSAGAICVLAIVCLPPSLGADPGDVGEPARVDRRFADARRTVEPDVRSIVAPWETAVFQAAARGFLPLGLRRQPRPGPRRERPGLGPRQTHDRLARIGE